MANNPNVKIHFFNRFCIYILLKKLDYDIPKNFQPRGWFSHFLILFVSVGMFILSAAFIESIPLYVFIFHILCLVQKAILALINKINYEQLKGNNTIGTRKRKITSPYHKLFVFYVVFFACIIFVSALALFKAPNINSDVVYTIVVYFSIFITFLQEILDGIVALYSATAKTRIIR